MTHQRKKEHDHKRITQGCKKCKAIQKKWYAKLKKAGFVDIEYGLDNPRFTVKTADPTSPDANEKQEYYNRVWAVFHTWQAAERSARDCRVAELYAAQSRKTGTVRGISKTLKAENLHPWSTSCVQATLKQIREAVKTGNSINSTTTVTYIGDRYAAA